MAFSEIERARVDRYAGGLCRRRNRPDLEDKLKLEYDHPRVEPIELRVSYVALSRLGR